MTFRRASFLFVCFHLLAPLLPRTSDAALSSSILQVINCSTSGNYTTTSAYGANVNQLLAVLPANAVSKNGGFYNGTVGEGPDTVYGLAMCPADYSRADCSDCLTAAAGSNVDGLTNRCPGSTTVLAMFDRCFLRYSNVSFFGTPEIGVVQALGGDMVRTSATYGQTVAQALNDKTNEAIISPQRFAASAGAPYVFVQCTWDLQPDKCKQCLDALSDNATNLFAIRTEGQRKSYSCTVRYSNTSFMVVPFRAVPVPGPPTPQSVDQTGTSPPSSGSRGSRAIIVVGVVIAVVVVACLVASLSYVLKLRRRRRTLRRTEDIQIVSSSCVKVHDGRFTYQQLQHATSNFAEEELLGQGGYGAVYKGRLEVEGIDRHVAIKKIIDTTSDQSRKEFANEIRIMRRVNHRNIIHLVGLCEEGDNLLLVYELMENGNLESKLYPRNGATDLEVYSEMDPATTPLLLDWHKRLNIVAGIASGLVYLHSECKERLLHRDIKPGNVMLDNSFNAKLCDFGLLTQVSHTKTSRTTEHICGTPVYIDPVYVDTSRVCEQNDVYSFGILMLEVVCCEKPKLLGTRNSLIDKVWTCYQSNEIVNAADQRLRGQFDEQITRVLMIGLSCVQPDRRLRPHIRRVMECLTNQAARLPSVSASSYSTVVLSANGSAASTSHDRNTTVDVYNTCPTMLPAQSSVVEDAGTTPFLSGP